MLVLNPCDKEMTRSRSALTVSIDWGVDIEKAGIKTQG